MKRYVTSLVIREMKVKLNEITFQFTGTLKINIVDSSTCYQECEATGTHKILGATENNSTVYRKMNKQTVTYSCSEIPPTNRNEWDY